jgi:uncharacterized protein (DUF488 family)
MQDHCTIFTIGHSSHKWEHFARLLASHAITAIADVRSAPFSRRSPHFNRGELKERLRNEGIAYSFLGRELGGRPIGKEYYCHGVADYEKMAEAPEFVEGIKRVVEGGQKYRIALLCSEHDPLDCHRCILVGRRLLDRECSVNHILADGSLETQKSIEDRLLVLEAQEDLFIPRRERVSAAYRERSKKVAYAEKPSLLAAE